MSDVLQLVTYNLGQGGSRDPAVWTRAIAELAPDLFFVQESRETAQAWLAALAATSAQSWLWSPVPARR